MENLEIERKFLLYPCSIKSFLQQSSYEYSVVDIEQFYILENSQFVRYRKIGENFIKTLKKGEGVVRQEYEEIISKEIYLEALRKKEGNIIKKKRYSVWIDNKKFEFDAFKDYLKGLNFLEIEFNSLEEALSFTLPQEIEKIVIDDVSTLSNFKNKSLALSSLIPTINSPCTNRKIHPFCDIKDILRVLIFSWVEKIELYRKKILQDSKDEEDLHQFRVVLRKIRAILKLFSFAFKDEFVIPLEKKLSQIMKVSNKARDIDVYLAKLPLYQQSLPISLQKSLIILQEYLKKEQIKAKIELQEFLKDAFYCHTMQELKEFAQNKSSFAFKDGFSKPIIIEAKELLISHFQKFVNNAKKLEQKSPSKKYHKVRIKAKELRYSLDFFSKVLDNKSYQKVENRLRKIQNILGDFHDLSVEQKQLEEFLHIEMLHNKKLKKALHFLIKNMKKEQKQKKKKFRKLFKRFKKSKKNLHKAICRY